MVCSDCEKKLSTGVCPDTWKAGSTNNNEMGSRRIGANKALGKSYAARRHNPYASAACTVCRQPTSQSFGKFCQSCAYAKGVCAVCGKQVLDTRFYAMGDGGLRKKKVHDPHSFHPEGWEPEGAPAAAGEEETSVTDPTAAAVKGAPAPANDGTGEWQLDPGSGYYFSVKAQAYFDATSQMYFVGGSWLAALPDAGPARAAPAATREVTRSGSAADA